MCVSHASVISCTKGFGTGMHDMIQPRAARRFAGAAHRQTGMTIWSLLYVLLTLGLIGLVAAKSLPVYLNAYDIRSTIEAVAADPAIKNASAVEIQRAVQRRFDAGYVDNIKGKDVAVKRVTNGREISVAYEVRRPMLLNVSLVYSFEEHARLASGDGG